MSVGPDRREERGDVRRRGGGRSNKAGARDRNIWVVVERRPEGIHPVSFELLSEGTRLAGSLDDRLVAVVFDHVSEAERARLGAFGAHAVLVLERGPGNGTPEEDAACLRRAVREESPSVVLAGATAYGRTLMPLVAVGLQTGLTADCTQLEIDRERRLLLQTRPAFGGNILATIECAEARPQMATVRPHVFKLRESPDAHLPEVRTLGVSARVERTARVLETIVEEENEDISMSDVIVAGGRGLGKADGFSLLEKLARRLGGAVGASRGAVDLGWISSAHQVGQTGHTVNPRLYIACGISGAVQHLAGIKGAEAVVAVNQDPEAPIFEAADYGIVGDLYEVLPALIAALDGGGEPDGGAEPDTG